FDQILYDAIHPDKTQPPAAIERWAHRHYEVLTESEWQHREDFSTLDGIQRVGWMLHAWSYAFRETTRPTASDAILIGKLIERKKNVQGLRTCGVRVGSTVCPPA